MVQRPRDRRPAVLELIPTPDFRGPGFYFERRLWRRGVALVAGADEAGRGCLAGPVVAAAVVLQPGREPRGLNDSKLLTPPVRVRLADAIRARARAVAIGVCSPGEIDELNILWASMEAMRRALEQLDVVPDHVLVDGNQRIPGAPWPCRPIVQGDGRSLSIAAASIIAKTHRDALMRAYHETHPEYGWDTNVGYPTPAHFSALAEHGPTPLHRTSFNLRLPGRKVTVPVETAPLFDGI